MHIDSTALDVVEMDQSRNPLGTFGAVAYSDPTNWHVFCPKPGQATVAHKELKKQGFATLNPKLITKVSVVNGKVTQNQIDLFGHYHFVQFDADDASCGWPSVHYTYGVRRLILNTSLRPATMPVAAMIPLLAHPVVYDEGVKGGDPSLVGETIEVLDGPWTSFQGTVIGTATGRVVALMSIFGRDTKTELPLNSIRVV